MTRIERLAAQVAEIRARRVAVASVPAAADKLRSLGFRVRSTWDTGLAVDQAPGLDAALDAIDRGTDITVIQVRDLASEEVTFGPWEEEG